MTKFCRFATCYHTAIWYWTASKGVLSTCYLSPFWNGTVSFPRTDSCPTLSWLLSNLSLSKWHELQKVQRLVPLPCQNGIEFSRNPHNHNITYVIISFFVYSLELKNDVLFMRRVPDRNDYTAISPFQSMSKNLLMLFWCTGAFQGFLPQCTEILLRVICKDFIISQISELQITLAEKQALKNAPQSKQRGTIGRNIALNLTVSFVVCTFVCGT